MDQSLLPDPEALRERARTMRRRIVEQSLASNVGHIGSALSIVELMVALWDGVMRDAGTDRGHAEVLGDVAGGRRQSNRRSRPSLCPHQSPRYWR